MTAADYQKLTAGVRQRGRALRLFLIDHFTGHRSYEAGCGIDAAEIREICARHPKGPSALKLTPQQIQFWYAPDITRDDSGAFRVIEDNLGFVGGMGDLCAFRDAMKVLGVSTSQRRDPIHFYRTLIRKYRAEAERCGGGDIVILSHPKKDRWNHEDTRLEAILRTFNVRATTSFHHFGIREDGVYLHGKRVGFLIINMNFSELKDRPGRRRTSTAFWQAVNRRQVGLSFVPGLDFVGDKSFCPRVESLIQLYLQEDCILSALQTLRLNEPKVRQMILNDRENWVIKKCDGQSGESVWVGRYLSEAVWRRVMNRVGARSTEFIAQRYCEPSRFLDCSTDLRPLAAVSASGVLVSPIPWGRASRKGAPKTNIACGGLLAPVAIR